MNMSFSEVAGKGQEAINGESKPKAVYLVAILFIMLCIVFLTKSTTVDGILLGGMVAALLLFVYRTVVFENRKKKRIKQWGTETVIPFLHSLPTQRVEVVGIDYTGQDDAIIRYIDEEGSLREQEVFGFVYKNDLLPNDKPYAEFKRLDEDLPIGYKKGWYLVTVYTPEDFAS